MISKLARILSASWWDTVFMFYLSIAACADLTHKVVLQLLELACTVSMLQY